MKYAIYKITDGKIDRFMVSDPSTVAIQCQEGEEFYLNCPDDATHIINNEPVIIVPEVVPPTLEEAQATKLATLAAARYNEEIAGIVLNEVTIATDRESQAMLTGAYVSLKQGFVPSVKWKGDNGWVMATLAEIEPTAQAVSIHVQTCFGKEFQLVEQVDLIASDTTLTDEEKITQINAVHW